MSVPAAGPLLPELPPQVPQVPHTGLGRLSRWIGRSVLRLGGWRVVGEVPPVARLVVIAAPHSSNWDGIWGMAAKLALGVDVRVLGKAQLFWWPLSPLLRKLGVVPVDRSSPQGTVEQAVRMLRQSEKMWFALTPEGTRKRVDKWKGGFLKIAHQAQVPILMAYFHYPEKIVGIGDVYYPTGDMDTDMRAIREWYQPWQGKNRGTV